MTNEQIRQEIAKAKGWRTAITHEVISGIPHLEYVDKDNVARGNPNWTEDIAAAWELVEEMRLAHVDPGIAGSWEFGGYTASFCNQAHAGEYDTFDAPTAPRAICLAWLSWKGIKI